MTDPAPKKKNSWEDVCAPIFTKEMGDRMRLMRMRIFLDQSQLGEKLGIGATSVCQLEQGNIRVPRTPFTVAKLREVFGDTTGFILYGTNAERFNRGAISSQFWHTKMVVDRDRTIDQSGDNHWTHKQPNRPRRLS